MKRKILIAFFSIFVVVAMFEMFTFNKTEQTVMQVEKKEFKAPEEADNTDNIASGTSGTCKWLIDKDGNLLIWPEDDISGTLGSSERSTEVPWNDYRKDIVSVNFLTKVYANENSIDLFDSCGNLTKIDFTNFDTTRASNIKMLSMFGTGGNAIKTITLGDKTNFRTDEPGGTAFGRGTWQKVEDGKNYSMIEICENSKIEGKATGTYKKVSNISKELKVNFPVTYKIEKISKIDTYSTTNEDVFKVVENNGVYDVFAIIDLANDGDYNVDGSINFTFKNVVSDIYNKKAYNIKMKMDNIKISDLVASDNPSQAYLHILRINNSINFNKYFYADLNDFSNGINLGSEDKSAVNYNISMQIVDSEGNPVEGTYIFSATDIDIGSYQDIADNGEILQRGYGDYSEGFNLNGNSGFNIDTLVVADPTFLTRTYNYKGNQNIIRITGTKEDCTSEYSEFLLQANNSSEINFEWTGGLGCTTTLFSYYQPQFVDIYLQNPQGENLPDGKLKLLYYEEEEGEWTTIDDGVTRKLMPGEYRLTEVKTPPNYDGADDIIFYVDINYRITRDGETVENIIMINDLKDSQVNVHYYIEGTEDPVPLTDGNTAEPVTINGKVTDDYTTEEPENIPEYYELVEKPSNAEGQITVNPIEVIYYYRLNNYPYTVNFYDKDTLNEDTGKYTKIADSKTKQATYGNTVESSSERISIAGYNYDSASKENIVIVTNADENVIDLYYTRKDSKITVKYVDKKGKIIEEDYVIEGKVFDKCNLDKVPDKIEGYTLISKTEEGIVEFDEEPRDVIFTYGKNAKVTVKYIDKNTNEVIETEDIEGIVDDNYTTDSKKFDGYVLVAEPSNKKGKMTEKDITVNYYYAKKSAGVTEKHIDINSGEVLYTKNTSGNEGDSYKIKPRDLENYDLVEDKMPKNAEGKMGVDETVVTYYYAKKAKVIVKYLEINTNRVVADEVTIDGHEGDSYNTEEKVLLRYSFLKLEGEASGKMKAGESEVIYYYTAIRVDQGTTNPQNASPANSSSSAGNVVTTSNPSSIITSDIKTGDILPIIAIGIILIVISVNVIQIVITNKKK